MPARTSAPVLFRHPSSREHNTGTHPERAARIEAIDAAIAARGGLGFEARSSPAADDALLTAVHPQAHVDRIRQLCENGGGWIDGDTVCSPESFTAAAHAAGGAAALVDALLGEGRPAGASVHRPPGHHAEVGRAMGFCLFNSVAVAARRARDAHGARRVLILDWDVHHGNGTEDVFRGTDEVLFISIHESPLYPGTGPASQIGTGSGAGYTVNLPVPEGSGDAEFTALVAHVAAPLVRAYRPDLVLISAGFDAHADDPLAGCTVSDDGYATMAATMRAVSDEIGVPVGVLLEGGYDLGALARGMTVTLEAIGAEEHGGAPEVEDHPLAAAARERLAEHWPALVRGD
ncbi:histone deacetylase [Paraconexibacter sp.]|uniref:histone deacetylase family protein n=1 Tax=Paraconexibacter sp. TaxID=2949640 RepID=UPI003564FE7B